MPETNEQTQTRQPLTDDPPARWPHLLIIPEETYTIEINGQLYGGFRLVSRWQGLTLFERADKCSVIVPDPENLISSAFRKVFLESERGIETVAIKASTQLLRSIEKAEE
jgi:hypothetical protein